MTKKTIEITNRLGLHARAAAKLSHLCNTFQSDIFLTYNENKVNAKSLLGILTLAASVGSLDERIRNMEKDEERKDSSEF